MGGGNFLLIVTGVVLGASAMAGARLLKLDSIASARGPKEGGKGPHLGTLYGLGPTTAPRWKRGPEKSGQQQITESNLLRRANGDEGQFSNARPRRENRSRLSVTGCRRRALEGLRAADLDGLQSASNSGSPASATRDFATLLNG